MALTKVTGDVLTANVDIASPVFSGTATGTYTLAGTPTITNPTLTLQSENVSPFIGFRNRIINGAMLIDQRNAGAAITGVTSAVTYMCDRWYFQAAGGATVTIQQSTTAPTGFTHSAYATVTSSGTPSYGFIQQNIEGNNIIGLNMGSNDSRITVSFWVRSSITGTYSVSVQDSTYGNSYNATYSISASNTWEYKSVTIPGYSGGTWNTTNTQGFSLRFALISSAGGTPNTWVSSSQNGSTNNVNWFGTNGATFYVTGVQLERGTVATPFEWRPFGQELALCQRYFELTGDIYFRTYNTSGSPYRMFTPFKVSKRNASSTVTVRTVGGDDFTGGTAGSVTISGSNYAVTSVSTTSWLYIWETTSNPGTTANHDVGYKLVISNEL